MARDKVGKVMDEFKQGKLRSGSATGPKVRNRKQALAIGLSEARKARGNPEPAGARALAARTGAAKRAGKSNLGKKLANIPI